jgi:hypothetical protein
VADNDATPAGPVAFDIEKPACFYLGREYDLTSRQVLPDRFVMYDARDLTTHGVIVGMTGSGKTGLAITVLEEAAIDGIPSIILDPKGDLTNLLLQFPDLSPARFADWLSPDDLPEEQGKKVAVAEYARRLSERWRRGLADSAQTPERITRLSRAADYRIYTPGSEAGFPLSILSSFAAPRDRLALEDLSQKINATATALLGLTGIASDPIQSREHVLIAQLLHNAWTHGRDLDLPRLIKEIQDPPIRTVGTYNLETFFPGKERVKFASMLNNVLASPIFTTWTMGEPLDLGDMLYRGGKPQHLIFYLAHLDDNQRMFFIALLLEEVLSWTRRQSGSTNLRALLYFDEVFGYLPPYPANPPSKAPLLTLLKQARAFGVGVLLATQNPVDLDYKALSNAGTWFVGKLQTERDKARLLEGLESVAAEQGTLTDRHYLETVIASLGNRLFLLHNIHQPAPVLFQSRWALSFLRGPLTKDQVSRLMKPLKQKGQEAAPAAIPLCTHCHAELGPDVRDRCPQCGANPWANDSFRRQDREFRARLTRPSASEDNGSLSSSRASTAHLAPVLPPDVTQFYLPLAQRPAPGAAVEYQPHVLGFAEVVFVIDKRKGREHRQIVHLLAHPSDPGHPVNWNTAQSIEEKFEPQPLVRARWANVPGGLDTGRKLNALEKAFANYLYSSQKLSLLQNRPLELVSEPGEDAASFQARCRAAAQKEAEQAVEVTRAKFQPRFEALGVELPDDPALARSSSTIWDWITSLASSKQPSGPPSSRQEEKERKLTGDYLAKLAEIREKWKHIGDQATPIEVKPRKVDVHVTHFGLAWVPVVPAVR